MQHMMRTEANIITIITSTTIILMVSVIVLILVATVLVGKIFSGFSSSNHCCVIG